MSANTTDLEHGERPPAAPWRPVIEACNLTGVFCMISSLLIMANAVPLWWLSDSGTYHLTVATWLIPSLAGFIMGCIWRPYRPLKTPRQIENQVIITLAELMLLAYQGWMYFNILPSSVRGY